MTATTFPSAPAPAGRDLLDATLTFLSTTLGLQLPADEIADAVRRGTGAAGSHSFAEAVAHVADRVGIGVTAAARPLGEVLADADTSFPWLAFREQSDGAVAGLAVLKGVRRGARVVLLGADPRPATWSRASLRRWLGIGDDRTPVTWLVPESTASLTALRTATGQPRLRPAARLRALLGNERRTLGIAVVYSIVIGLLSLVAPIAVQSLVNTIAFGSTRQPLLVLTLFVLVALGFSTVMNAARAFVVEVVQRSIFARVAADVTWRLVRVRADAFDRFHGPELVNRFFDTVTVQKSAALLLIDGLSVAMQTAIGLLLLAVYHPWLLVFDVLLVAAMVGIVFGLGRGAIDTSIQESKAKYALEAWLEQIAASLVTFKSGGGARLAFQRSYALLDRYLSYRATHFRILIRQIAGAFALQAVASAALLGIGGALVINRQLTLGQLVAAELVVTLMLSAFTKFGKQLEVFYDLSAAMDKLGDLIDLPLERAGGGSAPASGGPAGITLRQAELRYHDAPSAALRIEALTIAPGERLGVTGPHGGGKSTLADILFGLRPLSTGTMLVEGVDLRDVALDEWRARTALVRHVELFSGTIADNVRAGLEVDDTQVADALRTVGLLDELRALPDGLSTQLQPHGRPLSHRQACRLMLARALLRSPRLLIVDGLLDLIDRDDDRAQLLDVLFAPGASWTLVCITAQPSVLARCTRVIHLRHGLVETTPAEGAGA